MKRYFTLVFCILTAMLASIAVYAEKTTVDPNTVTQPAESEVSKSDARLDQKITYTAKQKRLHTVLDEISEKTGVVVRAGKNNNDWQVRDLPIFVCVKDMPLRDLLQHIADTTHLLLSSSDVDGVSQYRMWMDAARRKAVEDYLVAKKEFELAHANWQWDTLVRIGTIPEAELRKHVHHEICPDCHEAHTNDDDVTSTIQFAKMLNLLPPGTKERVFSGEDVHIKSADMQPALLNMVKEISAENERKREAERAEESFESGDDDEEEDYYEPPVSDVDRSLIIITSPNESLGGARIIVQDSSGMPCRCDGDTSFFDESITGDEPEAPEPPLSDCAAGFSSPADDKEADEVKVKTEKLKVGGKPSCADLLEKIAQEFGYSIICEDFVSQEENYYGDEEEEAQEYTLSEAIGSYGFYDVKWCRDKIGEVYLGSPNSWYEDHANLVPESLLQSLQVKLDGSGLELDDIAGLASLTEGQLREWVHPLQRKNSTWFVPGFNEQPFWQLYNSLSENQKKSARSISGLPLVALDPQLVQGMFAKYAQEKEKMRAQMDEAREMSGMGGSIDADEFMNFAMVMESNPDLEKKVTEFVEQKYSELQDPDPETMQDFDFGQMLADIKAQFPELAEYAASSEIPTDPAAISKLSLFIECKEQDDYYYADEECEDEEAEEIEVTEDSEDAEEEYTEPVRTGVKRYTYNAYIKGDKVMIPLKFGSQEFPIYSEKRLQQLREQNMKALNR